MYQSGPNWNESTKIDRNTMLIWLNKASASFYILYIYFRFCIYIWNKFEYIWELNNLIILATKTMASKYKESPPLNSNHNHKIDPIIRETHSHVSLWNYNFDYTKAQIKFQFRQVLLLLRYAYFCVQIFKREWFDWLNSQAVYYYYIAIIEADGWYTICWA